MSVKEQHIKLSVGGERRKARRRDGKSGAGWRERKRERRSKEAKEREQSM